MISHRQKWEGIEICIVTPFNRKAHALKVQAALELIREVASFRIRHIRRETRFILVTPASYAIAEWWTGARVCELCDKHMNDPARTPKHVAATLIHEITHGRIHRAGIRYVESRRAEIEAVCRREEIRFARRLPDGEDIIRRAEWMLTQENEELSDAILRERKRASLKEDGTPQWLINRLCPEKRNAQEKQTTADKRQA